MLLSIDAALWAFPRFLEKRVSMAETDEFCLPRVDPLVEVVVVRLVPRFLVRGIFFQFLVLGTRADFCTCTDSS